MNAEALIGTVLGTCTLQQLVGQGGMGAVYLAQQSRPRRQVAVKVLLPATALKPHQLSAFLERFRRETDAAASLEHPNIMPVYEYGERGGLAYLVMPYIGGGTLRDIMEQEGQLPLSKVLYYLEQMAAALDFAHARGVIHRDIKPANMLLTQDGRLLLTDFGLVKIISDEQPAQARLTGAGAPVGTPDYMSPEQVMGDEVDGRADQYSLGIILYQMVTGTTPFQGETPMQIAAQQLHTQPAAPHLLRPDLPPAAEQIILHALSKRPDDRFAFCQQLASAFRMALFPAEQQFNITNKLPTPGEFTTQSAFTAPRLFTPRGLLDPKWQTGKTGTLFAYANEQAAPAPTAMDTTSESVTPARSTGLLSRTGMFPRVGLGTTTGAMPAAGSDMLATPPNAFPPSTGAQPAMYAQMADTQQPFPTAGLQQLSPALNFSTGALAAPGTEQGAGNTIKLTGPMKVVQVPVAPGQYMTGLLPVTPRQQPPAPASTGRVKTVQKIIIAAVLAVLLISIAATGFWFVHSRGATSQHTNPGPAASTPNPQATMMAQATADAQANIVLYDPLNQNLHNWPTSDPKAYAFKNGAYHITDPGNNGIAVVLEESFPETSLGYAITMQEIAGDDTSVNNSFGMILRYNQQTRGNQTINTFYSFEIVNTNGGEYRFYKYDNSKGAAVSPWTELWHQGFGREFKEGHAANSINTIKVFANGNAFTFIVNGKKVGNTTDNSYKSGTVGMLVNLKGTEVAFSNLYITRN